MLSSWIPYNQITGIETIAVRHIQVHEYSVRPNQSSLVHTIDAVMRKKDTTSKSAQKRGNQHPVCLRVIDYQYLLADKVTHSRDIPICGMGAASWCAPGSSVTLPYQSTH